MLARTLQLLSLLTLLLAGTVAMAENATHADGYTIHHNAFLTSELSPEMASRYGIRRSNNRGMINISIIKDVQGTTGKAVTAKVTVTGRNLRGQVRRIPLREVKEENAVYYLGDFLVENGEQITFDIEVVPEGTHKPLHATLDQQFFTRQVGAGRASSGPAESPARPQSGGPAGYAKTG